MQPPMQMRRCQITHLCSRTQSRSSLSRPRLQGEPPRLASETRHRVPPPILPGAYKQNQDTVAMPRGWSSGKKAVFIKDYLRYKVPLTGLPVDERAFVSLITWHRARASF